MPPGAQLPTSHFKALNNDEHSMFQRLAEWPAHDSYAGVASPVEFPSAWLR